MPSDLTRTIRVEALSRSYDVLIGNAIRFDLAGAIKKAVPGARRAAFFTDRGIVEGSVIMCVHRSLEGTGLSIVHESGMSLTPSEAMKTLVTVESLVSAMTAARLDRNDVAVVLGGGVLGDLVGFAAATYRRGIRWINLPSTLLSMVDASVGGKTGTNLLIDGSLKKNMVGAFWQPSLVAADVGLLQTLTDRHFRAGLAECIKHGMIAADWGDPGLGEWTSASLTKILSRDPATLTELVARNVAVKARVVGTDEREESPDESGGRALLNLGHTFGHVIETLPGLSPDGDPKNAPLHHGEAVALGLIAAAAAAAKVGLCSGDLLERTRASIAAAGLPTSVAGLPSTRDLICLMMDDKKVAGGKLRLVLPCGAGLCRVMSDPPREAVEAGLGAIVRSDG